MPLFKSEMAADLPQVHVLFRTGYQSVLYILHLRSFILMLLWYILSHFHRYVNRNSKKDRKYFFVDGDA